MKRRNAILIMGGLPAFSIASGRDENQEKNAKKLDVLGFWEIIPDGKVRVTILNYEEGKYLIRLKDGLSPLSYHLNPETPGVGQGLRVPKDANSSYGWSLLWSGTMKNPATVDMDFELEGVSRRELLELNCELASFSILLFFIEISQLIDEKSFPDGSDIILNLKHRPKR